MLILFDHGTPKGLIPALAGHDIITAQSRGWDKLDNEALLTAAEEFGIELLLTTDRRIRYQQNLAGRKLALVVLTGTTKWSRIRQHFRQIAAAVNRPRPVVMPKLRFPSAHSRVRAAAGAVVVSQ
jgi:hypothetical protein